MRFLNLPFVALFFLLICFNLNLNAQPSSDRVYQDIQLLQSGKVNFEILSLLKESNFKSIQVQIPEKNFGLILQEVNLFTDDFFVSNSAGEIYFPEGKFYQGRLDNDPKSIATLSIFQGELVVSWSDSEGNFELTNDGKFDYKIRQIFPVTDSKFNCYTEDVSPDKVDPKGQGNAENVVCKSIGIYFEADYDLYLKKGSSVQSTVNYITALFNQVSILYSNEQLNVQISQIKVWNTPDPYISQTSISNVLNKFRTTLNGTFNGNLAHLLTTRSLGGGIAYVDVLCFKSFAVGVSSITTTFQNIPTYSWSIEVVTHELGHNIGSWHTQSCNWPQGALDNCALPEGNCNSGPAPVGGGTIMSYCHLTGYGINFTKGFGPVPGNHIRNKFNNAACLNGSSSFPNGLNVTSLTQTQAKLTWTAVPGITYYFLQYKKNSGSTWTKFDSLQGTSLTLGGLTSGTLYDWQIKTECSGYSPTQNFTTLTPGGGCGLLTGVQVGSITQTSAIVSWNQVPIATSYILQFKKVGSNFWTEVNGITATNYQITILNAGTDYLVKVRSNCNATFSSEIPFTTSIGGSCPTPTNLATEQITGGWARLNWTDQTPNNWFIGIKLSSQLQWFTLGPINFKPVILSGLQPATTYNWRVKNNCSDWSYTMTFTTQNFQDPNTGELKLEPKLIVYPNPANDNLQLLGNMSENCRVFDSLGKLALEDSCPDGNLNIENLTSGLFFLNIDNQWIKFVKN